MYSIQKSIYYAHHYHEIKRKPTGFGCYHFWKTKITGALGFEEEKAEFDDLTEKFNLQAEEYVELMTEKEEEERRIFEEKLYYFVCSRSARRIQRYWRAYRQRKIDRRKARKAAKAAKAKA